MADKCKGVSDEQLEAEFARRDADGSGALNKEEIKECIRDCVQATGQEMSEEDLTDVSAAVHDLCDKDNNDKVTLDEFKKAMKGM